MQDVGDFALGGRVRQKSTGRVGEIVRHDPCDKLLTFKVSFGDGRVPYADWLPGEALESLVANICDDGVGSCAESISETMMLSRLSSDCAVPVLPSSEAAGASRWGYCLEIGPRSRMEDAVIIAERMEPSIAQGTFSEFYGILDGHGGVGTVDFVKRVLATRVRSHELAGRHDQMKTILRDAFLRLDADVMQALVRAHGTDASSKSRTLSSGCCVCVASVCDSTLTIASSGDCRALLVCTGEPPEVKPLSRDHNPLEKEERSRLQACGVDVTADGYLSGEINISRAFGDMDLRTKAKLSGIIVDPDVVEHTLDDRAEFLLLACDGVFENVDAREAAAEVRRALRQTSSPQLAAKALVSLALSKPGSDNVSAVVVRFKDPPALERTAPRRLLNLKPRSTKGA
eukprot:TRINITY_DN7666_c0_g1_i2.p1 TRINITY_DN7666_c0_g1~~TRINITY_DN7666_c0_g1_i2.p1  ORF type:complete len:401 (-),score=43.03 TRINITY_DN7666_c0_g1_i2:484-1686(-)